MNHAKNVFPNDVESCHAVILSLRDQMRAQFAAYQEHLREQQHQLCVKNEELAATQAELATVFEQLRHAHLHFFGRSSEKFSPDQLGLCFNVATIDWLAPTEGNILKSCISLQVEMGNARSALKMEHGHVREN